MHELPNLIRILIPLLLSAVVLFGVVRFVGQFITRSLAINPNSPDQNIALGSLVLVSILAVCITGLKTVFLPVFLYAGFRCWKTRQSLKRAHLDGKFLKDIGLLALYFVFLFVLQSRFVFYDGQLSVLYKDNYAYAQLLNLMSGFGIESNFSDLEGVAYGLKPGAVPYHYFEFWLGVAALKITSLGGHIIYNLFLIPFLGAILFFQASRFLAAKGIDWYGMEVLFPVAFFTTLRFAFVDDGFFYVVEQIIGFTPAITKAVFFQNYGHWHFFSYLHGLKLIVTFLFLFPLLTASMKNFSAGSMIYLAAMPFVSVTYIPFVLVITGLLAAYSVYNKQTLSLVLPSFSAVFVLGYYWAFSTSYAGSPQEGTLLNQLVESLLQFRFAPWPLVFGITSAFLENYYWVSLFLMVPVLVITRDKRSRFLAFLFCLYPFLYIRYGVLFKLFLLMGFILLVLVFYRNFKRVPINVRIVLVGLLCLFLAVNLFSQVVDIFQIYSLIAIPIIYCILFLISSRLWKRVVRFKVPIVLLLLGWVLHNSYGVISDNRRATLSARPASGFEARATQWCRQEGKILSVYYAPFTMLPYIYYDRLGDDILHFTNRFYTTPLAMFTLTKMDTALLKHTRVFRQFEQFPYSIWLRTKKGLPKREGERQIAFMREKGVTFVLREDKFPREKLSFLSPHLVDSVYNSRSKYWLYRVDFKQ